MDRNITCGKTLLRTIDYLHNNPARRGLVERDSRPPTPSGPDARGNDRIGKGQALEGGTNQSSLIRFPGIGWPTLDLCRDSAGLCSTKPSHPPFHNPRHAVADGSSGTGVCSRQSGTGVSPALCFSPGANLPAPIASARSV
jgi:hypothetical protein